MAILVAALVLAGCGGSSGSRGVRVHAATWSLPGGARGALLPPPGGRARALVILIHGGGWSGLDPAQYAATKRLAREYTRRDYAALVVDYRAGHAGVTDVDRLYVRARRAVGRHLPVCASGGSAGGHLALMLAVHHPDLACAVSLAGPTDLIALSRGPNRAEGAGVAARFANHLDADSPARHARRIRAGLFLAYATNDPYVPVSQGRLMARAKPGARLFVLHPGHKLFIHSYVDAAQLARAQRAEVSFLADHALPSG